MAVLKLFELGKLSSAEAAELAGMWHVDLFEAFGRYRVPIYNYGEDDVASELASDAEATKDARAQRHLLA